jgi:hypothetical protein
LPIFPEFVLGYHSDLSRRALESIMLEEEFKKQRARTVRDLAEKAADPFIKTRLQNLAARYEDDGLRTPTALTPVDLQFESRGTGPERS